MKNKNKKTNNGPLTLSPGEDPAVVEVIVSFPRSLESCPVSVTLQQELKGEAVDHPMVLEEVVEEGQRGLSRLEYVQPEERGELSREEVSIWRFFFFFFNLVFVLFVCFVC